MAEARARPADNDSRQQQRADHARGFGDNALSLSADDATASKARKRGAE
jgi:hypothetical protein